MRVVFYCGYYPNRAHEQLQPRTEDYWNSYFFVWAVKIGSFKRPFYIDTPARVYITKDNFVLVRKTFGQWAAQQIPTFSKERVSFVPVPSKDGLVGRPTYRSLDMAIEAFAETPYGDSVVDGLRWNKQVPKAHVGGSRKRTVLLPFLEALPAVKGKQIILIDELFSTGGSLLACADRLTASDAQVLGAITCGRTIYDFNTPPFSTQEFDLTTELADWPLA